MLNTTFFSATLSQSHNDLFGLRKNIIRQIVMDYDLRRQDSHLILDTTPWIYIHEFMCDTRPIYTPERANQMRLEEFLFDDLCEKNPDLSSTLLQLKDNLNIVKRELQQCIAEISSSGSPLHTAIRNIRTNIFDSRAETALCLAALNALGAKNIEALRSFNAFTNLLVMLRNNLPTRSSSPSLI